MRRDNKLPDDKRRLLLDKLLRELQPLGNAVELQRTLSQLEAEVFESSSSVDAYFRAMGARVTQLRAQLLHSTARTVTGESEPEQQRAATGAEAGPQPARWQQQQQGQPQQQHRRHPPLLGYRGGGGSHGTPSDRAVVAGSSEADADAMQSGGHAGAAAAGGEAAAAAPPVAEQQRRAGEVPSESGEGSTTGPADADPLSAHGAGGGATSAARPAPLNYRSYSVISYAAGGLTQPQQPGSGHSLVISTFAAGGGGGGSSRIAAAGGGAGGSGVGVGPGGGGGAGGGISHSAPLLRLYPVMAVAAGASIDAAPPQQLPWEQSLPPTSPRGGVAAPSLAVASGSGRHGNPSGGGAGASHPTGNTQQPEGFPRWPPLGMHAPPTHADVSVGGTQQQRNSRAAAFADSAAVVSAPGGVSGAAAGAYGGRPSPPGPAGHGNTGGGNGDDGSSRAPTRLAEPLRAQDAQGDMAMADTAALQFLPMLDALMYDNLVPYPEPLGPDPSRPHPQFAAMPGQPPQQQQQQQQQQEQPAYFARGADGIGARFAPVPPPGAPPALSRPATGIREAHMQQGLWAAAQPPPSHEGVAAVAMLASGAAERDDEPLIPLDRLRDTADPMSLLHEVLPDLISPLEGAPVPRGVRSRAFEGPAMEAAAYRVPALAESAGQQATPQAPPQLLRPAAGSVRATSDPSMPGLHLPLGAAGIGSAGPAQDSEQDGTPLERRAKSPRASFDYRSPFAPHSPAAAGPGGNEDAGRTERVGSVALGQRSPLLLQADVYNYGHVHQQEAAVAAAGVLPRSQTMAAGDHAQAQLSPAAGRPMLRNFTLPPRLHVPGGVGPDTRAEHAPAAGCNQITAVQAGGGAGRVSDAFLRGSWTAGVPAGGAALGAAGMAGALQTVAAEAAQRYATGAASLRSSWSVGDAASNFALQHLGTASNFPAGSMGAPTGGPSLQQALQYTEHQLRLQPPGTQHLQPHSVFAGLSAARVLRPPPLNVGSTDGYSSHSATPSPSPYGNAPALSPYGSGVAQLLSSGGSAALQGLSLAQRTPTTSPAGAGAAGLGASGSTIPHTHTSTVGQASPIRPMGDGGPQAAAAAAAYSPVGRASGLPTPTFAQPHTLLGPTSLPDPARTPAVPRAGNAGVAGVGSGSTGSGSHGPAVSLDRGVAGSAGHGGSTGYGGSGGSGTISGSGGASAARTGTAAHNSGSGVGGSGGSGGTGNNGGLETASADLLMVLDDDVMRECFDAAAAPEDMDMLEQEVLAEFQATPTSNWNAAPPADADFPAPQPRRQ